MSSGFSGGVPDFFTAGRRSVIAPVNSNNSNNHNQNLHHHHQQQQHTSVFRSPLSGFSPDPVAVQIAAAQRRPNLIGKRSLAEYQQQQQSYLQQQHGLGFYLRNVKQRPNYHHNSPVSTLSPVDFSPVSSFTNSAAVDLSPSRFGFPIFHNQTQQHVNNNVSSSIFLPNPVQNHVFPISNSENKSLNHRLQELEKALLGDEGDDDVVSVVTNSEWSDTTIQNLISPISPSPTSSSSSCTSTSASPPIACPKQSLIEAATAISEGKSEAATEYLTRLQHVANKQGIPEQRLTAYMISALKFRLNPTENPPLMSELYGKEQSIATQMLYEVSPCFKLGFMAANLAILEATQGFDKIHVLDFDIGQGGQYVHLLHALAAKKSQGIFNEGLKITAFSSDEENLKIVGEGLKSLANRVGVRFTICVKNSKIEELSRENLNVRPDEGLAVNFAFKLHLLPDESVTVENLRDDLLRRVKSLSPAVMTVVEREMNANTAPLAARVRDACEHYGALFDSLDSTVSRESSDRVRIEEGLSRRMVNSVACEGRERVERCEVFGKWRARVGMAGFEIRPMSQLVADSLRGKLNSGTRGNPGFGVKEECGGVSFGWMGRTITVASAWS